MTLFSDYSASFARLAQRPLAALTVLLALLVLAAAWSLPVGLESASLLSARAEPAWAPAGADLPVIDDLPLRRSHGAPSTGVLWTLVCLGAVLLLALGDAVLVRASSSDAWPGLRRAWGDAVGQLVPLSVIALVALAWVGGAALLSFGLIGRMAGTAAALAESEWSAVALGLIPDAVWIALAAPVVVAADLARARLVVSGKRSGALGVVWASNRLLRSYVPWVAAGGALALDAIVVFAASLWRPLWDPLTAPLPLFAAAAMLLVLLARIVVHGAYVGTLGRYARRLDGPGASA